MADSAGDPSASQAHQRQDRWQRMRPWAIGTTLFAFGVVASLLGLVAHGALWPGPEQLAADDVEKAIAQALASATAAPTSAEVYQSILPSLVVIQTERGVSEQYSAFGIGTGVVINDSAAILTALHIVDGAADIRVHFADGTQSSAAIATTDPENDIAVLVPSTLPGVFRPATMGSSGAMRIGDDVFAVGNPLGLAGSMSAGVISGFDRTFTPADSDRKLKGVIQFDAAVNPGNSGGPLLNRYGQVVGIVTGLVNPTEQDVFIGIGFAVPIDVAARAAGGPAQ